MLVSNYSVTGMANVLIYMKANIQKKSLKKNLSNGMYLAHGRGFLVFGALSAKQA